MSTHDVMTPSATVRAAPQALTVAVRAEAAVNVHPRARATVECVRERMKAFGS